MKLYILLLLPVLVSAHNMAFPPQPDWPKLLLLSDYRLVNEMKNEYIINNFVGLVHQNGYPAEEHNVITEDGYHITFFRIPGSPNYPKKKGKPVIFIQHGLTASSDLWIMLGPDKDLAYLAADAGYDVWVGNVRGNSYGRSHDYLSPDHDPEFWEYSYHEIALYDLPAMIDYVLETTGQKTLSYIGHSQGTTITYVLLSTKPEYNKKFRINISLSPVTYWVNNKMQGILDLAMQNVDLLEKIFEKNYYYEMFPQSPVNILLAEILCKDSSIFQSICAALYFQVSGVNVAQLNSSAISHILRHGPAGTSTQSFLHYSQNIEKGTFEAYDYGNKFKNMKKYNQTSPPSYNVKNVVAPSALIYGLGDVLSSEDEAFYLAKLLPNVVALEAVPDKNFGHLDFLFAIDIKQLLNDRILKILSKFKYDNNTPANSFRKTKFALQ